MSDKLFSELEKYIKAAHRESLDPTSHEFSQSIDDIYYRNVPQSLWPSVYDDFHKIVSLHISLEYSRDKAASYLIQRVIAREEDRQSLLPKISKRYPDLDLSESMQAVEKFSV